MHKQRHMAAHIPEGNSIAERAAKAIAAQPRRHGVGRKMSCSPLWALTRPTCWLQLSLMISHAEVHSVQSVLDATATVALCRTTHSLL